MNATRPHAVIDFVVDPSSNAILSKARGIISLPAVLQHIERKTRAGVVDWPELFDARDIVIDISAADLLEIGETMRKVMAGKRPSKAALVTNSNFIHGLARVYADLTKTDNPQFRIFTDYDEGRAWVCDLS